MWLMRALDHLDVSPLINIFCFRSVRTQARLGIEGSISTWILYLLDFIIVYARKHIIFFF